MPMYRKRASFVEAYRMPKEGEEPSDGLVFFLEANGVHFGDDVEIETPGGLMYAKPGDWIVKVAEGELYPCDGAAFAADYTTLNGDTP